jgi:hypothetical protein
VDEALQVSLSRLGGEGGDNCLSAVQLCHLTGNHTRLKELARERGDALSYAAAAINQRTAR